MATPNHNERFMRAALAEARKGVGLTSPNPAVGAVLISKNKILARGHHRGAGLPHAEIECLTRLSRKPPKDAALYVTLEPCCTVGRTGPCTDAIIESGVRKVIIGAIDPNPKHSGRGIERLRKAGLDVQVGVLSAECIVLNESYNKWIRSGIPFVIAKCGMSLDGRLTAPPSESQWLTSPSSRRDAHRLRATVDAVLVGAETIRADNPRLTVRGKPGAKQPRRIVVSRSGKLPRTARIFTDRFAKFTTVYRDIGLRDLLRKLGANEITSVLIEGGGNVLGQALDERLIDKVQIYLAPMFTGGSTVAFADAGADSTQSAARITGIRYERIGNDVCIVGYPTYESSNS
ncbi:MAG TPA: bifunctional diaminohydroxyphosphoribosylaminopyrimidine deaminase/5-amino-6-(5-phosphoribosylamino)uracil reductase RibD [Chthoniobacterales bacterium]|nr:bifunctional diaminohydroxyphosphoribosylaminopyrimidine deaminase/5-amino-6-(5-phosphoribosylamino)uracil reductase RibD [Chthoniobacterales bacterium]